jgi:hypothetical protein
MPIASAAILGGTSILSGVIGGKGAKKAANVQADYGNQALQLQKSIYDQNRADLAPWRAAGGEAIGMGLDMLKPGYDYTASPGYQFRLSEGLKGVENSAAAKGILESGGTLAGIDKYSEGLASQDYNDQFNRVMSVANGGQQAATNTAQLGANSANAQGDILGQIGNARASGYMGTANAINGTIGNLAQIATMMPGMGFGGSGGGGSGGSGYGYRYGGY